MATKADFRNIALQDLPKAEFPADVFHEYRVHMAAEAYDAMMAHAGTTSEVEICGVLIGKVARDERGPFLLIRSVIEGENANNYGAQVTFTQQTWTHINQVKDREYPTDLIIGWYHTHPGFGVFLSAMDTFIQENFFNGPHMVAMVIETKQKKIGCFAWKDGKCTALSRMWIDKKETPLSGGGAEEFNATKAGADAPPATRESSRETSRDEEPPMFFKWGFVIVLCALVFLLGQFWGKSTAFEELRNLGLSALESEVYSVLEFAASMQVASQDMARAREAVQDARKRMDTGDSAGAKAKLDQLTGDLDRMEKVYSRPRSQYREQLAKLATQKQGISQRFEAVQGRQLEVEALLANLYLFRIYDLVLQKGEKDQDLSLYTEQERTYLRQHLDLVLRRWPELKTDIQSRFPWLIKQMYPSSDPSKPKEGAPLKDG
jgi:proteasome lid subunit RPN8/RPN11